MPRRVSKRLQKSAPADAKENEQNGGKADDKDANNTNDQPAVVPAGDADEHLTIKRKKLEEELHVEHSGNLQAKPEVDIECKELARTAHVYMNADGHYYDVMLNQTNIQQNNNKFYLLQLLEANAGGQYWVWLRWGRVGFKGQTSLAPMNNNLNGAIKMFHSKFYEKTHNQFLDSRDNFQKVSGKYDLIRIDYTRKVVTEEEEQIQKKEGQQNGQSSGENGKNEPPKSSLDEKVKQLMQTICDMRIMESEAQRLDYDFKRIPLGKITKEQIKAGYEALTRIEKYIRDQEFGQEFKEAVNEYYTRIPHSFGMRIPPMITTTEMLKHEIDLLDLLTGIEIAVKEIAGDPIDTHYSRLKWELTPLDNDDEKFKLIEEYLRNTQGPTHYQYRLNLRNIFELKSRDEKGKHFREDLGNRKLLWHGSRLTNWYSILAQGLRIAPPEAPVTGYMFGKGVYFADCSTKSANYSMGGPGKPGFMLLSEVALGEILELRQADDQIHNKLPSQKQSVRGIGRMLPNPREAKTIDGIEVPCGKLLKCGDDATSLIYNEFIVYNLSQIRERFLVEIEFQFDFNI